MSNVSSTSLLMILSAIAGTLLLVGTMLLVGFRRIYIDSETKQPTEVELPILGKFKTQAPALVLIFVGAVLVMFPITQSRPDMGTIHGIAKLNGHSVNLVVVAVPNYEATLDGEGPYKLSVPILKDANYRVKFIGEKQVLGEQAANFEKGEASLADFVYGPDANVSNQAKPIPIKEVPDALLQKLGIAH